MSLEQHLRHKRAVLSLLKDEVLHRELSARSYTAKARLLCKEIESLERQLGLSPGAPVHLPSEIADNSDTSRSTAAPNGAPGDPGTGDLVAPHETKEAASTR